MARCSGWLHRQLELLDPPVVVALGLSAAKWFLGPRTVLARARHGRTRRRPGGLGDLPPLGGHPLRPERRPAAPGWPTSPAVAEACREAGARPADARGHPRARPRPRRACCGPATSSSSSGPWVRARPRSPRASAWASASGSRSPRRRSSSPACTAAAGCRWCTSTPTGSAAWPTSTTSTCDASTGADAVTVVEWGQGLVERLADEHLEVRLDRGDDDVRTAVLVPHGPGWEERLAWGHRLR